jgi:hypothetical protein
MKMIIRTITILELGIIMITSEVVSCITSFEHVIIALVEVVVVVPPAQRDYVACGVLASKSSCC